MGALALVLALGSSVVWGSADFAGGLLTRRLPVFGVTIVSAIAAWGARETYRIRLNELGDPNAVPMPKSEYDRMRASSIAVATL